MLHNKGTALQALLHSYSCLDFASILDVTQLRMHKLRRLMKDRVQNRCFVMLLYYLHLLREPAALQDAAERLLMQCYLARLYLSGCAGAEHIAVSRYAQCYRLRE